MKEGEGRNELPQGKGKRRMKVVDKILRAMEEQKLSVDETERLAYLPTGSLGRILCGSRAITETQIERLEEVIEMGIDRRELMPASYYMRDI